MAWKFFEFFCKQHAWVVRFISFRIEQKQQKSPTGGVTSLKKSQYYGKNQESKKIVEAFFLG